MGRTITHSGTVGIRLAHRSDTPLTVAAGVTIATAGGLAVDGVGMVPWRVVNDGSLSAAATGVLLRHGGSVKNGSAQDRSAAISAGRYGVVIEGGAGTVANAGTVSASSAYTAHAQYYYKGSRGTGVQLTSGGLVRNGTPGGSHALISGALYGVWIAGGNGTVGNTATIAASSAFTRISSYGRSCAFRGTGVALTGGQVTNGAPSITSALISGGAIGVAIADDGGKVANFGTISASSTTTSRNTEKGGNGRTLVGTGILLGGGIVVNGSVGDSTASIVGGKYGVVVNGAGSVANEGTIKASGYRYDLYYGISVNYSGVAVSMRFGGRVTNGASTRSHALIQSSDVGVSVAGASGTVVNDGAIVGFGVDTYAAYPGAPKMPTTIGSGVLLLAGGDVLNGAPGLTSASITGGAVGVGISGGPGTVTNYGTITGATAVAFGAGMVFATLTNAGVITGSGGIAASFASGNDTVVIRQGGVFNGSVVASTTGSNTVVLGRDDTTQSFGGLGTSFQNFGTIAEQAGARWDLAGANTFTDGLPNHLTVSLATGSSLLVTGSLTVDGGDFAVLFLNGNGTFGVDAAGSVTIGAGGTSRAGAITVEAGSASARPGYLQASGTIAASVVDDGDIAARGSLVLQGNVSGGGVLAIRDGTVEARQGLSVRSISFNDSQPGERLLLDQPQAVSSTISGFVQSQAIDLVGRTVTGIALNTASGVLTVSGAGGTVASLHFGGTYAVGAFGFGSDGRGERTSFSSRPAQQRHRGWISTIPNRDGAGFSTRAAAPA